MNTKYQITYRGKILILDRQIYSTQLYLKILRDSSFENHILKNSRPGQKLNVKIICVDSCQYEEKITPIHYFTNIF